MTSSHGGDDIGERPGVGDKRDLLPVFQQHNTVATQSTSVKNTLSYYVPVTLAPMFL